MPSDIKSIEKAVRILDILAKKGALPLQELTQQCAYPKSTVYGILSTLRNFHMVEQESVSGRYMLGMHLFELGNAVRCSLDAVSIARKYMPEIAQTIGETVGLWMYEEDEVICLFQQDSANPMRIVTEAGTRFPMNATAMGKAILTWMPERERCLKRLAKTKHLVGFTPHTIVDEAGMQAEFARVANNGVAIENGEHFIGLRAVAAPVFDGSGFPLYALTVIGMFRGIQDEKFVNAARIVWQTAKNISGELGYMKAYPDYKYL